MLCYAYDLDEKLPDGNPHNHGQVRVEEYAVLYQEKGERVIFQTPQGKDFNADLKTFKGVMLELAYEDGLEESQQ